MNTINGSLCFSKIVVSLQLTKNKFHLGRSLRGILEQPLFGTAILKNACDDQHLVLWFPSKEVGPVYTTVHDSLVFSIYLSSSYVWPTTLDKVTADRN